jgi:hypothetical protein
VHNPMPAASRFAAHGRTNQLIEGGCHFTAALRAVAEGGRGVGSDAVVGISGHTSGVSEYMQAPDTLSASVRFASGACGSLVTSYAVNKRRFEVMATGTRGGVFLERVRRDCSAGLSACAAVCMTLCLDGNAALRLAFSRACVMP